MSKKKLQPKQYLTGAALSTPKPCTWCPGCGDFGIWSAFRAACMQEKWDNKNTALVAGIGCHGHIINFVKITAFEGLHGRALPVASGLKMANHDLNVFVFTGDGDSLSEGGNHFIHAARRNQNLTVILHDNALYALTTGQASPRTPKGQVTKSTPGGNIDDPLHPLRLALSAGATFLAREYSGNVESLKEIIIEANKHEGFSVIQVMQPCVSFNKVYTHRFFQENIYKLPEDYDPTDTFSAYQKTFEWDYKKIPVGILYQEKRKSYEAQLPVISKKTLVKQPVKKKTITSLYKKFI
ncbi:MAG: 2-oxoacid ferredoxin oxidoreductase [Candidatus Magasanikbacteria bacterium CG11_big_fil_rev_8_21_14_0_20_39_34]|uniref:2-oxoacid ferredoxin oxidoreductase n=1 Tax=Candidatus Magasanikbacteria bacterium CG11_big_fil_rev_8_21_14_0_20_39_34 TaxID=1974653 RepID=A0A2H0N3X8_9BACT|nr:MAG: 2-oxoacid ferredoxin oxidoreductase [Candidatus Magasanikbacteria bacterium CG11_big_fil_rev_8_21_14_0_20_39_34]